MTRQYFTSSGEGLVPPYRELQTDYRTRPFSPKQLKILLDTRTRGSEGDTLAVLYRGRAGTKRSRISTLESLSLRRIGDARLGASSDGSFHGQVLAVPEKLRIVYFDEPVFTQAGPNASGVLMSDLVTPYGHGPDAGEITALASGEYFQVELSDGKPSVLWSSSCSLVDVLAPIITRQQPAQDIGMVILRDSEFQSRLDYEEQVGKGDAREVLQYILSNSSANIAYARIPFPDYTLVWRRDVTKITPDSDPFQEVSLVYSDPSMVFDEETFAKTASPELASHAHEIVKSSGLLQSL